MNQDSVTDLSTLEVPSPEEPVTKCSSWEEFADSLNEDFDNNDTVLASNAEVTNIPSTASRFPHYDMKTFGSKPLKDESGIVNCNGCSKKVLPRGFIEHSANCEKIKALEAAQNVDISTEVSDLANRNTKNSTIETYNSNKKRKKSVEVEVTDTKRPNSPTTTGAKTSTEKKQKTKKEKEKKKTTGGRHKGPIDLDKQCGVIAPPNNTPCTRSLTCKSHSMSSKRAVVGRSQTYDILLAQYQKKSIGRPQNNGVPNNKQDNTKKDGKIVIPEKDEEVVDSDEEVEAVMEAIMYSKPQPLVTRSAPYVPQRKNYFTIFNDILPKGIA